MKIANGGQGNVVDSSGVQTTSTFNIARTPHMFRMMSSGLYSDKIGAVLREVGCNAMDAHIMYGTGERPFQVKLPSALDRTFYVKDWGPGLDDRETRELYTTYGWSSKQQRDDVTGAFGLGSKSPFAYTLENEDDSDGFTVESIKDGVKRIYTCYIGEDGAPAISRMFEGPADDPQWQHGVKVTFPVQQKDVAEFHEKAKEIYRWFNYKPEVLGLNGTVEDAHFKMKASFFGLGTQRGSSQEEPAVIMGNVRYPLNGKRLRDLSKTEEALLNAGIHLWVPMGTVMMTPSREELEYTDRTRKGVKEWLEKAALDVANTVRDAVQQPEPTKWAWFRKIQQYAESLPFGVSMQLEEFLKVAGMKKEGIADVMKSVREKYAEVPGWVGNGIGGPRPVYLKDPDTGRVDYQRVDTSADMRGHRAWLYTKSTLRESGVARKEIVNGGIRVSADKVEEVKVPFTAKAKAFYADSSLTDARMKGLIRSGELEQAILFVPCKGTEQTFAKEVAERFTAEGDFEGFPVAGTSSLPIPQEVEDARRRRKLQREQSPREFYAEFETKYLSLQSGKFVETTLGDLGDSDMFYLCGSNIEDYRRARFWSSGGTSDSQVYFGGYERSEIIEAMKTVVTSLGLPVSGFIVVDGEAKAKKLKLAEQGFQQFLPFLREQIQANWAKLTAGVNRTPKVPFENMWQADDYGWLGMFGHHMVKNTPFWKAMSLNVTLTDVARATRDFVAVARPGKDDDEEGMTPVQAALMKLASKVSGININTSDLTAERPYDIKNEFLEQHPLFAGIQESTMQTWMNEDVQLAIGLLCAVRNQELARAALAAKTKTAPAPAASEATA